MGGKGSPFDLIRGCHDIAHTSFREEHFGGAGVLFDFASQAIDILLEKVRIDSVIWSLDTMKQLGMTNHPTLISD